MPGWIEEVDELHAFFEDWIGGAIARSEERFGRVEEALAETFTFVTPSGELLGREAILAGIREAHGARPGLRITIREPVLLHLTEDHVVASYEEWQETEGECSGRISTVVFQRSQRARNGLTWIHVHETWLPGRAPS